jgi:hypothetical protein
MNTIPWAVPNEARKAQLTAYLPISNGAPFFKNHPLLSSAALHWPSSSTSNVATMAPMGTSPQAFLSHSLLGLPILQPDSEYIIQEALANEKIRLVRNIVRLQQQPVPSTPVEVPSATRVVDLIGSQIRTGEPYIDVTKLPGIEQAEAVSPRTNRGGHVETFPEVSWHFWY